MNITSITIPGPSYAITKPGLSNTITRPGPFNAITRAGPSNAIISPGPSNAFTRSGPSNAITSPGLPMLAQSKANQIPIGSRSEANNFDTITTVVQVHVEDK